MIASELKKQLKKPFIWVFAGLCLLVNLYTVLPDCYAYELIKREASLTECVSRDGEDFLAQTSGRDIVYNLACPSKNAYLYPYYLFYARDVDFMELRELAAGISAPVMDKRIAEINTNGEHRTVNGGARLHSVIYSLMLLILAESVVFAVLIAVRVGAFEHTEGTAQVLYSTKCGRGLLGIKLLAALILSESFLSAMFVVCYTALFIRIPCAELLKAPCFVMDQKVFSIPWTSITVWEYFLLNVAFCFVLTELFTLMGYFMWGYTRNVYAACAGTVILCFLMFLFTLTVPPVPTFRLAALSTPVTLVINSPGGWFALAWKSVPIPLFECVSAALWTVVFAAMTMFAMKKLRRMKL